MRETQINIRLGPEEKAQFDRVAEHFSLNIPNMIRLLVKHADQELTEQQRLSWEADDPAWERAKKYVAWLVPLVNRFKLEVIPDDVTRTFTISSPRVPPIGTRSMLTFDETVAALERWEGGDVLRIDPHSLVVTYSPSRMGRIIEAEPPEDAIGETTRAAVERWRARQEDEKPKKKR